ncbi:RICIN domain-containing protein [Streptomyces sp. NPDC058685]|uniref:RICIN domain-containing protein n=1 Tax=Streptomyces sp. NPDC058685 TaxID=3346598 RepID=UPI003651CA6F
MARMPPRDRQISAEIGLPFLKIGTNDVGAFFKRRERRSTGPFLLLSVTSGLALDTALERSDGSHPHLWGTHGQPHQLWNFEPSGHKEEVRIVSVGNNLVLDGQTLQAADGHQHPRMRGRSDLDVPWQRWRIVPAPDRRAHRIINAGTGLALDCPWEAGVRTRPVLWEPNEGENQHWLLAMPFVSSEDNA